MIRLLLVQDGMESDVTESKVITGNANSEIVFSCDPADQVSRLWARSRDFSVNRDYSIDKISDRMRIGSAADFISGLTLRVVTASGGIRMTYNVETNKDITTRNNPSEPPAPPISPATPPSPALPIFPVTSPPQTSSVSPAVSPTPVPPIEPPAPNTPAIDPHELVVLREERDQAISRVKELEKELSVFSEYASLRSTIGTLQSEVEGLRRNVNKLKNDKFELEEDILPAAKADLQSAREVLERCTADVEALNEQIAKAQESLRKKEDELVSLETRHMDVARALEDLKACREQIGMNDAEILETEKKLAASAALLTEKQRELTETETDLSIVKTKLTETTSAIETTKADISAIDEKRVSLESRVRQLDKEVTTLTNLENQKAREWEEKVRRLSAILAEVLQTQLDLRASYELLTVSFKDETFTRIGKNARENMDKLKKCGVLLDEVNDWVRNIKASQAEET